MINRELLRLSVCVFLFLYCEGRVLSQSSQESEYQEIVEEGIAEYEAGRFDEARRLFEEAHAMKPSARTLRGIGIVAFGARDYVTAVKALERALVDKRRPLPAKMRKHAASVLQRAKLFVARYTLRIDPLGEDVALTIDGNSTKLPQDGVLLVNPGERQLVITASGYKTEIRKITAMNGKNSKLTVQLVPIGEQQVGNPERPAVVAEERKNIDESLKVDYDETDTDSTFEVLAWISVGLSALSIGGGIAALFLRNSKADEYNNCDTTTADNACLDAGNGVTDAEILMGVGFAGGGVFAATAITFFVLDHNQSKSETRAMACGIGSGLAGVSCHLKF